MNKLAIVFVFKISATVLFWCVPLILFPTPVLEAVGLPSYPTYMFVRMLGWAYLALCVGYAFGLRWAIYGQRAAGPIWVGIVSNGGACLYLAYFGIAGTWVVWGSFVQFVLWSSVLATAATTAGLLLFGIRGDAAAQQGAAADRLRSASLPQDGG